jgi:sialate O-acetylesterase
MQAPGSWQGAGLNYNGVVWFRRDVDVPAAWAGKDLVLNLAPCDKHDTTYFNNVEVGGIGLENPDAWKTPRCYRIPGRLVKAGRNVIAVRIFSYVYAGGFMGSPAEMKLDPPDGAAGQTPIMLHGDWRYQVEHNFGPITPVALQAPLGPGNQNSPYSLYNGMIAPLIPYGLRGAIWYQGESNASRPSEYRTLFPAMIRCWRDEWKQGDFPFLLVQLANYMAANAHPVESQWAELREAQALALKLPNTGMAVAIDIGDAADIHPKNKQEVGKRLAAWGLNAFYGRKDVVPSGPLYAGMAVEGNRIRIRFEHVAGGLVVRGGGPLTGFAIAGPAPDGLPRRFVWADAVVDGETVVVSSPAVPDPTAVRYAWANNPACNLYNAAGLPAAPFRTDGPE